jgi:hypothetical protein
VTDDESLWIWRYAFANSEPRLRRGVRQPSMDLDPALVAGIDLNLDNLVVFASNKPGFQPLLVNGRPLKSIN